MLHEETLTLLNYAGRRARTVLEIGPYIGGSTVAIGDGLKSVADPMHLIVEVGGAYLEHPHYPTSDIVRDLKAHIAEHQLVGTHLIEGWSHLPATFNAVTRALGERKVDLLFIDADGNTEENFQLYRLYLSPQCMIVLDDFLIYEEYASGKQADVRAWVGDAIDAGIVRDLGTFLWGTWAGQMV